MTLSRRERGLLLLLTVVAGIWGGRILWQRFDPGTSGAGGGRQGLAGSADFAVPRLRLAALEPESSTLEIGRDPFRYARLPEPEPERRPPPPPRRRPEAARQPSGPRLPRLELSYLGSFGPEGRTIAVFSDGETIINAMQGDVVEEKFIVETIGFESVDLGFVDFPDQPAQRLPAGR